MNARLASIFIGLIGLAVLATSSWTIRETTPVPDQTNVIALYEGTCADLPHVPLHLLRDIGTPGAVSTPGILTSTTTVDVSMNDLTSGNRAIDLHESIDRRSLACGDIDASITAAGPDGGIAIGLREINDSGYTGIAVLEPASASGQTIITVYLAKALASSATPAIDSRPGNDGISRITIHDLIFDPPAVIISTGQPVSWTNQDPIAHTIIPRDRNAFAPGTLQPGETLTRTFSTPGIYEYFCEFHGTMRGVIVVR